MKNLFYLVLVLFFTSSYGQSKEITLDYTVTYQVPNAKKNTIDTVSVSYNKEGTYLYTNARFLIDTFSTSVFKSGNVDFSKSTSNIIYDSHNTDVYMYLDFQGNVIYMKMNLDAVIPTTSDSFDENIKVITEKATENDFILNKSYPKYLVYPENEPQSILEMVVDEDLSVNNNLILSKFFELMLTKTKSEGSIEMDIPEGLILSVSSNGTYMIKAFEVEKKPIKINLSHSFKVEK